MRYWRKIEENVSNQKVEMGGCSELSQQSGFCPNGLIVDAPASVTRNLDQGCLAKAERRTAQLISCIQPNRVSEMRRNSVASYVKRLISKCVPCEVFTFGSVPLKTYLPDGDIDLTVFSEDQSLKDTWAKEVQHMLQMEENNEHAEFSVKEVQLILAEVKLIKCLVDNIVVDISFNQLGGLCTLCFLEEVDNLISQNHLFKRSIILVKAWCYYESRILGAHHGLISTYALETLVLYIFHVFNNSFTGPLEVLYRFLEFFSIFDWANFCVSLWGPVPICSLPNMAAAPPRKDGGSLLLSKMFLESCGTAYSVSRVAPEIRDSRFISKHFNVVDPLRLNNNLGRSVSKGNFFRIRSAFSLGAQQLATILDCPGEDIVPQLDQFFMNTWDRHGKDCRPDVPLLDSGCSDLEVDSVKLNTLPLHSTSRTKDSHKVLSVPKQKDQDESRSHLSSERSKLWKKQHDDIKRTCRMNIVQTNGTTNHFARTSSSPELTSMSNEVASTSRRNVAKVGDDIVSRSGNSRRMKASGTMENHVANHFNDEPSVRESSSHHSLASGSDHSSGSCVSKPVYSSTTPVVASAHEFRQRSMEEQDFVNKLSSTSIQHHGGHAQMPVNLPSHSFVPFPPSIMGYSHHPNYAAPIPANLPSVESEWGSMVNYANGPFSVPFHQQFRPIRVNAEHDQMIRGFNERVVSPESGHVDEHSGFWIDHNGRSNREFDPESEDFSTASSRLLPGSPSASSRTKASSESSWDGKSGRLTNLSRYPVEKNASSIRNSGAIVNSRWEEDGEPVDRTCDDVNGSQRDWDHSPAVESATRIVTSPPLEVNQIPGFVQPQMGPQRSLSPFGPVLAHPGPHHGVVHNPAVLPVAFYPAGSHHHAFVTMVPVPVYNRPSEGSYGAASGHNNLERRKPPYPMNHVPVNRPDEQLSHTDHYDSNSINTSGERSEEAAPDIFSSDFVDHWKNLLYGRFCQESQLGHPFVYPPSISVPPQVQPQPKPQPQPQPQPQVTSTVVSPEQSTTVAHAVPVSAPHPVSAKPAGTSRRYGGHASKQRNGTGTYFPNPNIIKERQSTTTRPYRGDFSHNRNENFEDRGSHWNFNLKPRYNGRSQPRNYYEKPNTKVDRSAPSNFQTDKTWEGPFY